MQNYCKLMDAQKLNLAAACAILENNGEGVLFRTFDDILNVTYRIRIAEGLIKNEKESKEKEVIVESIKWYKESISKNIKEKKTLYASIISAEHAKTGQLERFYLDVIKAIEKEKEFDFYDWINEINIIR